MIKLITKRGVIQEKTSSVSFRLKEFDLDCYFLHRYKDLDIDDDVLMANDDYGDRAFWVNAYFNISKNKRSDTKQKAKSMLVGLTVIALLMVFCCIVAMKFTVIAILILLAVAFLSYFAIYALISYQILEKEIRHLGLEKNDNLSPLDEN
jgi:hypothetical protein